MNKKSSQNFELKLKKIISKSKKNTTLAHLGSTAKKLRLYVCLVSMRDFMKLSDISNAQIHVLAAIYRLRLFLLYLEIGKIELAKKNLEELVVSQEIITSNYDRLNIDGYFVQMINKGVLTRGTHDEDAWTLINEFLLNFSPHYDRILRDKTKFSPKDDLPNRNFNSKNDSNISVTLFIRMNWWEGDKNTRQHEMPLKFMRFFENERIPVRLFAPELINVQECGSPLTGTKGVALVDVQSSLFSGTSTGLEFLKRLKSLGYVIVALFFDYWAPSASYGLKHYSDFFDLVWYFGAEGEFAAKAKSRVFTMPFPLGVQPRELEVLRSTKGDRVLRFSGSFEGTNIWRIYWKAATSFVQGLDMVASDLRGNSTDGWAGYTAYLDRMVTAEGCLNFTMRQDGTRIANGRVFEAIAAGRLLVSEESKDINSYLTPWVHYLPFTNIEELTSIAEKYVAGEIDVDAIIASSTLHFKNLFSDSQIMKALKEELRHVC
jgi:hypothetical protein